MTGILIGLCVTSISLGAGTTYVHRNMKKKIMIAAAQKRLEERNTKVKQMNMLGKVGK